MSTSEEIQQVEKEIAALGDTIRTHKSNGAGKDITAPLVAQLQALKSKLQTLKGETTAAASAENDAKAEKKSKKDGKEKDKEDKVDAKQQRKQMWQNKLQDKDKDKVSSICCLTEHYHVAL